MRRLSIIAVMLLAAQTPVRAQSDVIVQLRDAYLAAVTDRDAVRVADLFADDALLVPPEGDLVRGRQEIAAYFANAFGQSDSAQLAFTSATAESENGFGSETGRFEERVTGTSGAYVLIYRQDASGRWRIAIEIRSQAPQDAAGSQ